MSGHGVPRGGGGKDLQAGGLGLIARGITLTLAELKELGMVGEAGAGRGFEDMALSGLELGHGGLTFAFESFCERWEWGVRSLVNEGNDFAEGVGLSAGTLHETDQYVEGALKIGANALGGNPYLSEEEVTSKSWDELGQDTYLHPDYSKESFENAWENSKQGWKDAGRDVMTSDVIGPGGMQRVSGMSDEQYGAMLDEAFGPSPEERAKAAAAEAQAQQGGGAG